MKKSLNLIFIIVFIALCTAPLVGRLLGFENVNAEKRSLAAVPAFAQDGEVNVDFTRQFDDYFTDNFAFRPNLITMYAYLNAGLFSDSVSDQVIIGKDGWLFFEPSLKDYIKTDVMSDNEIYRTVRTLDIEQRSLAQKGVAFIFTVAPNKASVYGQYMPDRFTAAGAVNNAGKLNAALAGSGVNYVNLFDALAGSDTQLYHKLDTHWNNTGALIGYNALLDEVAALEPGFTFDKHEGVTPVIEKTWQGDLSEMLFPTAGMLDYQSDYGIEKEFTTARPMKSPEDMIIDTSCESGSLGLIMFRDSFANMLIPLVSNEFSAVTYLRAVPYDFGRAGADTDVVILEIVERNLPNLTAQAPLIDAPEVELDSAPVQADIETRVKTEDAGDYIKITGTALPPGYSEDKNYDMYLRLSSGTDSRIYEAFPILDVEGFPDYTGSANAGFSMLISKDSLPEGDWNIDIIVGEAGAYLTHSAGASVSHPGR